MERNQISLRLLTISEQGTNLHNRWDALLPEFGIPLAAIFWQRSVARAHD